MSNRDTIKTGDLLIWSKSNTSSISSFILNTIRLFTKSEYAHVGIAWRVYGKLLVIEATIPEVHVIEVKDEEDFYHIPMNLRINNDNMSFLLDKLGLSYSIIDAIRGLLGMIPLKDDKWQCAELVNEFYKTLGIDLKEAYTPSDIVKTLISKDKKIKYIEVIK